MIFSFPKFTLDIDVEKTKGYYDAAKLVSEDFNLCWKELSAKNLDLIIGEPIEKVEPFMYNHINFFEGKNVLMLNGISFIVHSAIISIYNALDCNGIEIKTDGRHRTANEL
jgi:hypothetical protein